MKDLQCFILIFLVLIILYQFTAIWQHSLTLLLRGNLQNCSAKCMNEEECMVKKKYINNKEI